MTMSSTTLTIRLNADQAERLETESAELGVTRGSLIKERTFGGVAMTRRPRPDQVELRRLVGELGRIGNNFNQIASHLNEGGHLQDRHTLQRIECQLHALRQAVIQAIGVATP